MSRAPVSAAEHPATFRRVWESDALARIVCERVAQLEHHGHDASADADRPADALPRKANEYLIIAAECIRGFGPRDERDIPRARRKLVQAAALLVAAIERLEREQ